MIFVFLAFGGFESSAPLAEEARDPRRTVPRAILLATVCVGLLYPFCSYAGIVGWGPGNITAYASDENPWGTMAKRVWGPFSVVVFLAILNSGLGCANGNVNAATRVLYAMGRTQTLPPAFAHLNRFRVPDIAIFVTMLGAVIFSLWPGFVYGPKTAYALLGTLTALPIIAVYIATCISVPFFYRRERPQEFRVVSHVFVPLIPLVVLTSVLYFQFVPPPAPPLNLAGPIFAVWFLIGIIVVLVLRVRAPQSLAASNSIYVEPEEV
jgi:amino acid transporter